MQTFAFNAGRANHRIQIQRKSITRGPAGEEIVSWVNVITDTPDSKVWAEAWPLKGREFFTAQQTQYAADVRFRIRYRAGIEREHRIIWDGAPYDIIAIADVGADRQTLEILTVNGIRNGL